MQSACEFSKLGENFTQRMRNVRHDLAQGNGSLRGSSASQLHSSSLYDGVQVSLGVTLHNRLTKLEQSALQSMLS